MRKKKKPLMRNFESDERIGSFMDGYMRLSEMTFGDGKKDVYLYIPSRLDNLEQFVTFSDRVSGGDMEYDGGQRHIDGEGIQRFGHFRGRYGSDRT